MSQPANAPVLPDRRYWEERLRIIEQERASIRRLLGLQERPSSERTVSERPQE